MAKDRPEQAAALDRMREAIAEYITATSGDTGVMLDGVVAFASYMSAETMAEPDALSKSQVIIPDRQSIYLSMGLTTGLAGWVDAEWQALMFGDDD